MGNHSGKNNFKKRTTKATPTIDTITRLQATIDKMEKREIFLSKKAKTQLKMARDKHKAGNKKAALNYLRRKKMYDKEIEKIKSAKLNIQFQIMTIESAHMNIQTVTALKDGENTMKKLVNKNIVDDLEQLRESIEEHYETVEEINTIMTEPIGSMATMDEEELEAEFNELIAEELTEQLTSITMKIPSKLPHLPTAPTTEPAIDEDIAELEKLEREMSVA